MKRRLLAAALAALAWPASAAEVVSAGPDGMAATLYQSYLGQPDIALIAETRAIDLPAGESMIRFDGVASTLIPQTARVEGLPRAPRHVDFDYALLDAASILAKSVGRPAELVQAPPKGAEIRRAGTLVSQQGVLAFEDGAGVEAFGCGGPPARLLVGVPEGLRSAPSLSVRVRTEQAGRHTLRLSYLADRISWRAAYVARVGRDGRHLDIEGRIVLENNSATGFARVPTRFVAGEVPRTSETRAPAIDRERPRRDCWDNGRTSDPVFDTRRRDDDVEETTAMAFASGTGRAVPAPASLARAVEVEKLGDLKLYRLEEPMTIAARQQKLFTFLSARGVKADSLLAVTLAERRPVTGRPAQRLWRVGNTRAAGLGKPLPHGTVAIYGGGNTLLGTDTLPLAVAEGGTLELAGDPSGDVVYDHSIASEQREGVSFLRTRAVTLANVSGRAQSVELHLPQSQVQAVVSGLPRAIVRKGAFVAVLRLAAGEKRRLDIVTREAR